MSVILILALSVNPLIFTVPENSGRTGFGYTKTSPKLSLGLVEVPKNETIPLSVAKNTSPDTPSISISNTLLLGNGELLLSKR